VIQDPHAPSRLGLAGLLRLQPWVRRCDAAADQAGALRLIREHRPHVAVVDLSASGTFAADHCDALRRAQPGLALVGTSRCGRSSTEPSAAADAGVAAWLAADATVREITAAVRAAAEGGDGGLAPAVGPRDVAPPTPQLTEREAQVLRLLARGATNREIAAELHLGPDAIKKHASAVYRKLGVRNRTEAARRVRG
jgi:two-component system response regulator DesR